MGLEGTSVHFLAAIPRLVVQIRPLPSFLKMH